MNKVKQCLVRDAKWKVLWRNLSQGPVPEEERAMGWCHENKVIELDPSFTEALTAEIALHEFTHAFFSDLSEDAVSLFARQAIDFLSNIDLIHYEDEEDELK